MKPATSQRWVFLGAIALIAAALADVCLESAADRGWFGAGFRDTNDGGIAPVLASACALLLEFAVVRIVTLVRRRPPSPDPDRGDWLAAVAVDFGRRSPVRDLPVVFAAQLVTLFAIEASEAFVSGGRFPGGLLWLGGPVVIALGVHLAIGALCTAVLGSAMRAVVTALATIVRRALAFVSALAVRSAGPLVSRRGDTGCADVRAPLAREIGGRAPPGLTVFA